MDRGGASFREIAVLLAELGVKPHRRKSWYASSVNAVPRSKIATETVAYPSFAGCGPKAQAAGGAQGDRRLFQDNLAPRFQVFSTPCHCEIQCLMEHGGFRARNNTDWGKTSACAGMDG